MGKVLEIIKNDGMKKRFLIGEIYYMKCCFNLKLFRF